MPSKGWLRFRDLKARNIVKNWPNLKRKVKYQGFPPGRMTGPNERSWTEEEIDAYREGCPVEGPEPRGAAKKNRDRKAASAPPLPKVETGESRPSWRHAPPDETDLDQQGGGPGDLKPRTPARQTAAAERARKTDATTTTATS